MSKKENRGREIGGLLLAGLMVLGAGVAWLFKVKMVIGGAIGMGLGLLAMAGVIAYYGKKDDESGS